MIALSAVLLLRFRAYLLLPHFLVEVEDDRGRRYKQVAKWWSAGGWCVLD